MDDGRDIERLRVCHHLQPARFPRGLRIARAVRGTGAGQPDPDVHPGQHFCYRGGQCTGVRWVRRSLPLGALVDRCGAVVCG